MCLFFLYFNLIIPAFYLRREISTLKHAKYVYMGIFLMCEVMQVLYFPYSEKLAVACRSDVPAMTTLSLVKLAEPPIPDVREVPRVSPLAF